MRKSYALAIYLLCSINIFAQQAPQATLVTTVKAGNWSDSTIWSGGTIPGKSDSIVLSHDVIIDTNATCKSLAVNSHTLTINNGYTLLITGYPPKINDQVRIIDSAILKLVSDSLQMAGGLYRYQVNGTVPNIASGNVIVSGDYDGYLRKVTSATLTSGILELATTQADMEDVFKQANFKLGLDVGGMQQNFRQGPNSNPQLSAYTFSLGTTNLINTGTFSLKLLNANFNFAPNLSMDWDYGLSGIKSFEMSCNNAVLDGVMNFSLTTNGVSSGSRIDTVYKAGKRMRFIIGGVPIIVKADLFLIATTSYSADASLQQDFNYNTNNVFDAGVRYNNGSWQNNFQQKSTLNTLNVDMSGKAQVQVNVSIKPYLKTTFYGVVAPYYFVDLKQQLTGNVAVPALNWDVDYKAWAEPGLGATVKVFGKVIGDYGPKTWSTDSFHYRTPFKMLKDTGDYQVSTDTTISLPVPLKVRVLDELDFKQKNVKVYFSVEGGNGSVSNTEVVTDNNGFAQTSWRIGGTNPQSVKALAKKSDGTVVGAPVIFTATYGIDTAALLISHGTWTATTAGGTILLNFSQGGTGHFYDNINGTDTPVEWQYMPAQGTIRVKFIDDFFDWEENEITSFKFISFSATQMELLDLLSPTPWNYTFY